MLKTPVLLDVKLGFLDGLKDTRMGILLFTFPKSFIDKKQPKYALLISEII